MTATVITLYQGLKKRNVVRDITKPNTIHHDFANTTNINEIDVNQIEERYVNWLVGENINYDTPEIATRYIFYISAREGAKDISSYDINNLGAEWAYHYQKTVMN